jgi:hypothetical protein
MTNFSEKEDTPAIPRNAVLYRRDDKGGLDIADTVSGLVASIDRVVSGVALTKDTLPGFVRAVAVGLRETRQPPGPAERELTAELIAGLKDGTTGVLIVPQWRPAPRRVRGPGF